MLVRLQKFLADCGVDSRRVCEKLILAGKVRVGQLVIKKMGVKVDPRKDKIYCYNKLVQPPAKMVYIMLNKPKGYLTTVKDPQKRPTFMALLPKGLDIHPVGRLDKDSEGLLIFTNDGNLTQKLTHPKFNHEKEYLVKVDKLVSDKFINAFKNGVKLEEGIAKADNIFCVSAQEFKISIHQGWKRQIRRMAAALGYNIIFLRRVRIGKLNLDSLPVGRFKFIKREEIV